MLKKRKRLKKIIYILLLALVLVVTVVLKLLVSGSDALRSQAVVRESVVTAQAQKGTITDNLAAGGTLAQESAEAVTLPGSIEVESYAVSNGDFVQEGDLIARVDKTSVTDAITQVQEMMNDVDEALADAMDSDSTSEITAPAAGRVKAIYAKEDTSVMDTMYNDGALIRISLDGLMAADITAGDLVNVGDAVVVVLSDETEIDGKISAVSDGTATVTLDDTTAGDGEVVTIKTADGDALGEAALYIHSELKITGYAGTVEAIYVEVNEKVAEDEALLCLKNAEKTAWYTQLKQQRSDLEAQMTRLFQLFQTGELYADTAGEVSGINEDLLQISSSGVYEARLLSNSPTGEDDSGLTNYAAQVTGVSGSTLNVNAASAPVGALDYTRVTDLSRGIFTEAGSMAVGGTVVYTWQGGGWSAGSFADIQMGDIVVFTYDSSGNLVWIVRAYTGEMPVVPETPTETQTPTESETSSEPGTPEEPETPADTENPSEPCTPEEPGTPGDTVKPSEPGTPEEPGTPGDTEKPSESGIPEEPGTPGDTEKPSESGNTENPGTSGDPDPGNNGTNGSMPSGGTSSGSGMPSGFTGFTSPTTGGTGSLGGNVSSGTGEDISQTEETNTSYVVSETDIYNLTPHQTMAVDISIDELDIRWLSIGQEAKITLDALAGTQFTGEITAINATGENSGGNTKYTVTVSVERTEEMLSGMNAAIIIEMGKKDECIRIPEAALVEDGAKSYVYTSYDEAKDELGGRVEVETGAADGTDVEILSGLDAGSTVYYRYADSIEYSFISIR